MSKKGEEVIVVGVRVIHNPVLCCDGAVGARGCALPMPRVDFNSDTGFLGSNVVRREAVV